MSFEQRKASLLDLQVVEADKVDPVEAYGEVPAGRVAICGWGSIPDQYGRVSLEE